MSADSLYWALTLNHQAALLATPTSAPGYDTLQLVATPRTVTGAPLAGLPAVQYLSRDPNYVRVSSDGMLHAVQATPPAQTVTVLATLTTGNLKHIDSVIVMVKDEPNPPVLGSFSIHPPPGDSAKVASGPPFIVPPVQAMDIAGNPLTDIPISFRPSDPSLIRSFWISNPPMFFATAPGAFTLYSTTTVYGVRMADSVTYRVGWPVLIGIAAIKAQTASGQDSAYFSVPSLTMGVGAAARWFNDDFPEGFDITFDDSVVSRLAPGNTFAPLSSVSSNPLAEFFFQQFIRCNLDGDCTSTGQIPVVAAGGGGVVRVFTAPGVYNYRSNTLGISGSITVVDER